MASLWSCAASDSQDHDGPRDDPLWTKGVSAASWPYETGPWPCKASDDQQRGRRYRVMGSTSVRHVTTDQTRRPTVRVVMIAVVDGVENRTLVARMGDTGTREITL